MNKEMLERAVFWTVILVFSGVLVSESQAQVGLERQIPVQGKALYEQLAGGTRVQIIDVRPLKDDDNEDVGGYEYTHVPGSIPLPNCEPSQAPDGALDQIQFGVPTVIVSAEGDAAAFANCGARFDRARNLEGGMLGWVDAFLPEDEGEYVAPKAGAGGGCL